MKVKLLEPVAGYEVEGVFGAHVVPGKVMIWNGAVIDHIGDQSITGIRLTKAKPPEPERVTLAKDCLKAHQAGWPKCGCDWCKFAKLVIAEWEASNAAL